MSFYSVAGWVGALLLLTGFIWSLRVPEITRNRAYLVMNIFGAIGIIINTYAAGAYPAAVFNAIWATAALGQLAGQFRGGKSKTG